MAHSLAEGVLTARFQENFSAFEALLLSVANQPLFLTWLENYRGFLTQTSMDELKQQIDENFESPAVFAALQENVGLKLIEFFEVLFAESPKQDFAALSSADTKSLLVNVERTINLVLYTWHGPGNRNWQFRSIVHFLSLDGFGGRIFVHESVDYFVSFSPDGIRLGEAADDHFPRILAISKATAHVLRDHQNKSPPDAMTRMRALSRQICFLVDEWEYRNTILALEFQEAKSLVRSSPSRETHGLLVEVQEKLNHARDELACWAMESLADFQNFGWAVAQDFDDDADVASELEAFCALILASVQKIFLPASVSRHKYADKVSVLVKCWADSRLALFPDDVCTGLLSDALTYAKGETPGASTLTRLLDRPLRWTFAYDPCPGIKAFCWRFPSQVSVFMGCCILFAVHKKRTPKAIEPYWFFNVMSLVEMPQTFPDASSQSAGGTLFFDSPASVEIIKGAKDILSATRDIPANLEDQMCALGTILLAAIQTLEGVS